MSQAEKGQRETPGLGFVLGPGRFRSNTQPNKARAIFRARKALEEIVYDTVALEGNPFTFPEVKTLMEGTTVGGRRIEDAQQVLKQARSWRELIGRVESGAFRLDRTTFEQLHAHVAYEEALEWGCLRTGDVRIAGTTHGPPDAGSLPAQGGDRLARVVASGDPISTRCSQRRSTSIRFGMHVR